MKRRLLHRDRKALTLLKAWECVREEYRLALTLTRLDGGDGIGLECVFCNKLFPTGSNTVRSGINRKENRIFYLARMVLEFMGADLGEDDGLEWALVVDRSGDLVGDRRRMNQGPAVRDEHPGSGCGGVGDNV